MDKNRIGGLRCRASWRRTTKPISSKGTGGKFGGCARKAVDFTSGDRAKELSAQVRGWRGYFAFRQTSSVLQDLDQWLRRRRRSAIGKQWKRGRKRFAELRQRAIGRDLAMKHGFAAATLRPMAKELKTNARMLVYHFGSREGLMREVLTGLRLREDEVIRQWFLRRKTPPTLAAFLRWYWRRMSAPEARPAMLLIFELYALALRDPEAYPGVLTDPIAYWRDLASKAGVSGKGAAEATLLLAATRGLLLDLTATNQRARIGGAAKLLADLIEALATRREYASRRKTRPKKIELGRPQRGREFLLR